eukprot:TRINITY_DN1271_c1_g1_i1.p1 TRINITY_DN1271_c1_g1~~TRINITY_DN1271_c1_g1_i1.p1  ORF type:complete len:306 (+),score=149.63 TRINITY_DN1271_c1_g1_i1:70-987(+)
MGKIIGRFRLEDVVLGRGSYGEVRRGADVETGKKVAVKVMKKELLNKSPRQAKQLYREISIMKSLAHPNVVNLFDTYQTSNNIYMVMELVDGGELFNKIVESRQGLEENLARQYFQDLILGVRYVHEQGVAHRDLKPENILLSSTGIKISDFGLSNIQLTTESGQVVDHMQLQTVCGTPNYVAPEVLEKKGYNGFMADIWSCGVVLYVMLTGYLPFTDPHVPTLLGMILRGKYEIPSDMPSEASNMVSSLMQRNPEERISLEGIVSHKWFTNGFDMDRLNVGTCDPIDDDQPGSPQGAASPRGGA